MEFTIYRDSWRRGGAGDLISGSDGHKIYSLDKKHGVTRLYNKNKKMCCLGQISYECGIPLSKLLDVSYPSEIDADQRGKVDFMLEDPVDVDFFSNHAAAINDDSTVEEGTREARLIELFAQSGHELKFVDGVAPWFQESKQVTT